MTSWKDLREDLRRVVFRDGIDKGASAIPADRVTVYRLVNGKTDFPTLAVRAGVERIIRDDQPKDQT